MKKNIAVGGVYRVTILRLVGPRELLLPDGSNPEGVTRIEEGTILECTELTSESGWLGYGRYATLKLPDGSLYKERTYAGRGGFDLVWLEGASALEALATAAEQ